MRMGARRKLPVTPPRPSQNWTGAFDSSRLGLKVPAFSHAIRSCRESSVYVADAEEYRDW